MEKCDCGLLARAFVQWQEWSDDIYCLEDGLMAGTIFPCLNQPVSDYEWGEVK